jgi:hypothetical protein
MGIFDAFAPFLGGSSNDYNSQDDMSALTNAYKAAHLKLPAPVGGHNYAQATADLQLTPQERSLYERHLTNLNGPGGVDNPDGSRSTLYQANIEHNGKNYNIPTVYDGKIVPVPEAAARAQAQGWNNFPSYDTPEAAEARYQQMHKYMDADTAEHMANKGAYGNARVARGFDMFGPQSAPPAAPTFAQGSDPMTAGQNFAPAQDPMAPGALSAPQASPVSAPTRLAAPPLPQARPAEAAPDAPMGFFARNTAMMRDPSSGAFIDPQSAERAQAQASGPDVINKLLSYFHQKDA